MDFLTKIEIDNYSLDLQGKVKQKYQIKVLNKVYELLKQGNEMNVAFKLLGNNVIVSDSKTLLIKSNKGLYHRANRSGFFSETINSQVSLKLGIELLEKYLSVK